MYTFSRCSLFTAKLIYGIISEWFWPCDPATLGIVETWKLQCIRLGISSNEKKEFLKIKCLSEREWLLLSKLFYWSGKLWLLIKMRIQAFRNMNHSYDHYMKQEKIWSAHLDLQSDNGFMMNRSSRTLIFLMWNYILLNSSG